MVENISNGGFYHSFEEKYRGPRSLIKSRLAVYRQFVAPLLNLYTEAHAIDLGCGRGECLELLAEWGFQPVGVDLDAGMLAACHALGLKVEQAEAIAYLHDLPDESQVIVSAFHLVEHLPFDDLRTLVLESLRVLKPGGLLIMETPNPENLVVATRNFYLDPTHQRPIPSQLLSFVAEHTGYARVKTLGLQEPGDIAAKTGVTLSDVFHGASPDYAVIAQKHAPIPLLSHFDSVFRMEFGQSQDDLLVRWDRHMTSQIHQVESKAQQFAEAEAQRAEAESRAQVAEARVKEAEAESRAQVAEARVKEAEAESRAQVAEARVKEAEAESRAQVAEAELAAVRKELHVVHQANHHHWQQWEATKQELHEVHQSNHRHWQLAETRQQTIQALHNSLSWRITAPLRLVAGSLMRRDGTRAASPELTFKDRMIRWGMAQPRLVAGVHRAVDAFPGLRAAITQRVALAMSPRKVASSESVARVRDPVLSDLSGLSPRARQIHTDLKSAVARRHKDHN